MKLARNSAAEKSESESEGGQKFLFPDPFPFCPPERKIKNSFQKKFELPYKNSSKLKNARTNLVFFNFL
jgi:hypothetical protein